MLEQELVQSRLAPTWQRAAIGLLLPVLAVAAQLALGDDARHWYFLFLYPAVFFAAWIAGPWVGVGSTLVAAALANWFIISPQDSLGIDRTIDLLPLGVFVTMGVSFAWLQSTMRLSARRAELAEAQAESASRVAAAIATMPDAVLITDATGRFQQCNAAFAAFHRFDPSVTLAPPFREYVGLFTVMTRDLQVLPVHQWPVARALRGEAEVDLELVLRRRDITEEWIGAYTFAPMRDAQGRITGAVLVIRDVTARRRLEDHLADTAEALHEAQRLAKIGSWRWIRRTDTIDGSPEFHRMFGRTSLPKLADIGGVLIPDPDHNALFRRFIDLHTSSTEQTMDVASMRADGSRFWARIQFEPELDSTGGLVGAFGTLQDVTEELETLERIRSLNVELERVNAEMGEARRTAERANQAKTAFLNSISHELRTPLNAIIGFSSLLSSGESGPLSEEQARQVRMIQRAGEHQLSLVENVLDITSVEAGRLRVEKMPFALATALEEARQMIVASAAARGLHLQFELVPGSVLVEADPRRFRQVLMHLLSNAIKFTDTGTVSVQVDLEAGAAKVSVSDTGVGIPQDRVAALFETFGQAHTAGQRIYEGAGTGLALARQLVLAMGGDIGVRSEVGCGSTFWFTVPVPDFTRVEVPVREVASA